MCKHVDRENVGFGTIPLLGGFWGIRVTWLGFHSDSPHIIGTPSAAVERVLSFFGNKFDDQNLANAQIKGGLHLKAPCCCTTINAPLHLSYSKCNVTGCIFILIDYFCLRTNRAVKCIHILCTGLCIHNEIAFVRLFFVFCALRSWYDTCFLSLRWSIIG